MVEFCVDRFVDGRPYPNGAIWEARPYTAEWRQFSTNWPYSEPVHFFEYLDQCNIPYKFVEWTQATRHTLYPISISYFDFGVRWFDIIPSIIREKLRSKSITLWFFYSEGDDPVKIQQHLYDQARSQDIDTKLIQLVSANTIADTIPGCHYFADDECLYQLRNTDTPCDYHEHPRSRKFTALVRTHKWWRATTMARLWRDGYHTQGYFSYNTEIDINDDPNDNPISVDTYYNLRKHTQDFLKSGPFTADDLNSVQHNTYSTTVREHFSDSYLNVILETHLNVDSTNGTFLTEKTFKPIKHCQPFIMFAPYGSIKKLQEMGYQTFDHVIDHSYDNIGDNNKRWNAVYQEFQRLIHQDLDKLYRDCRNDLIHNQQLFLSPKESRLNILLEKILNYARNQSKQLY